MSNDYGYIKLYRKTLENPIICKDGDHLAVWCYLLLKATHKERDVMFKNQRIKLQPGELITGRKAISAKLNISEAKVQRILKLLKSEQQIEQQTSNKNRLVTILNWELYQNNEQQIEQQVNNKRTTSEQQVNTNKNDKNVKNDKNEEDTKESAVPFSKIKSLYNDTCLSLPKIKTMSEVRKTHVRARWKQYKEDYSVFETLFSKISESDFLQGKNKRGWKADFDWLMNENNMSKVLEGKYDNEINKGNVKQRFEQSEEIKPF